MLPLAVAEDDPSEIQKLHKLQAQAEKHLDENNPSEAREDLRDTIKFLEKEKEKSTGRHKKNLERQIRELNRIEKKLTRVNQRRKTWVKSTFKKSEAALENSIERR
jgi:hypothetical protein